MNSRSSIARLAALLVIAAPLVAPAQTPVSEDFTGTTTANPWYFFADACLTASAAAGVQPAGAGNNGQIPGCVAIQSAYNENLVGGQNGVAGPTQTLPDPNGQGALRFTNGNPGGLAQHGAIVSTNPFPTGQGVSITFKTVTYRGDSGGAGGDGADGISFFLTDASQAPNIGSWGGSLGYTCSNANPPYDGMVGAYVGLGIDEFGNFLNGANWMPGYNGPNLAKNDNTALGYGYKPNRIGMRGAGNIAWSWLSANYPQYYPSSGSSAFSPQQQQAAVQATCQSGLVWDLSHHGKAVKITGDTIPLYDYAPIPNAFVELPPSVQIANELAMSRPAATPIFYQLKISERGLLSLSYSINGGAYQQVINSQDITAANGPLPANFLFGFAGSTGGSTNIHEILCFRAAPATSAASSAGGSEKQSAQLQSGVQAYFAYYDPNNGWTGRVTASNLGFDSFGNVVLSPTPTWDAACTLTGVPGGSTCPTTGVAGQIPAQAPASRAILSWNGSQGIPLEWGNLTSGQQSALTAGDTSGSPSLSSQSCPTSPSPAPYSASARLNYLRGDRSCEVSTAGVGLFRRRSDVLGDIIDSSPSWVGPPIAPYAAAWSDRLYPSATTPETASGAQTYAQFVTAAQTRMNVVYVGSNDGLMHGFRTGSYDANGNFVATGNDGQEVLAYMPGAVVQTIHSTTNNVDYSNVQYGHNFFVDATPATGEVFYGSQWHTWLASGLGPGGNGLFALDITNPTPSSFTEANAANLVIGEWNSATISCAGSAGGSACGGNLGNTYGTPAFRRLHDGKWAMIFGNGIGSSTGDAGIFIMTIDPNTAARTFYYLSAGTGSAASPNGIAFVSPADLDADHITDYVYAGDLQGNLWRFDLTSSNESSWAMSPGPLFKTPAGQPITTGIAIASGAPSPGMQQQLMLLFGTGQKTPLTNTSPATYASGAQGLYGVWDWNMGAWNAYASVQYASLAAAATGLSSPYTLSVANLQQQIVTVNPTTSDREITTNSTICWAGQSSCATGLQFGWYLNLPGTQEQIIYTPELVLQALTVNSVVPASSSPTSCSLPTDTGFTYVVSAMTGGAFNQVFLPPSEATNSAINTNPRYTDSVAVGIQTNATGTSFVTSNAAGTRFLVYETNQLGSASGNIVGGTLGLNLPANTTGRRLSWIERR